MKFWQKMSLFSLLAFIVVVGASSVLVIERNHGKLLMQAADSALNESVSIRSSVDAIAPALRLYDSPEYDKEALANLANVFVAKKGEGRDYLEITSAADGEIFSNLDFKMPANRKELKDLKSDETRYIIRDVGQRTLLFTVNKLDVKGQSYLLSYAKDVTSLYEERRDQYRFFVKVDIVACALYLLAMYLISKGLTRPIDNMVRTANVIAEGAFSERVALGTKDELGVLASRFNQMVAVVESKILDLERNNEEKQRFINNITHELKTPLTSIIAYADYLKVTKYEEGAFLDGLQVILGEAKRLEALSVKLMELILLGQDEHSYRLRPCRLSDILNGMKPQLAFIGQKSSNRVRISVEAEEDSDRVLQLDEDLIRILILNLVDNAVKASSEQGRIEVRSMLAEDRRLIALEVSDEGAGIAPEYLDKIFEPFFMADKSRTKSRNGAGLGLTLCKSIADIHHARFEVSSALDQGTTFRVVFDPDRNQSLEVPLEP